MSALDLATIVFLRQLLPGKAVDFDDLRISIGHLSQVVKRLRGMGVYVVAEGSVDTTFFFIDDTKAANRALGVLLRQFASGTAMQ